MASEPLAKVRYTDFSEVSKLPGLRTRSLKKKKVFGSSGSSYRFKQQGRPTNSNSQWLPVRNQEDVEYFEGREGFEVQRER